MDVFAEVWSDPMKGLSACIQIQTVIGPAQFLGGRCLVPRRSRGPLGEQPPFVPVEQSRLYLQD
ncbi:hypothetical protein NQZ68_008757 [Dissostichus eleginoides]|nr:hypothetical protein NQZ68_008757 [Dissostichus eleginoides]